MLGSWPQRLKNNELRKSAIMFRICSFISFSELKNQKKLLRTNVACCCKAAKSVSSLWAPSPQNRNTRGVSECDISKHFLGGLLIAIEKWLQADHLLILWRDMLVMLVQAQDARHATGTSNPTNCNELHESRVNKCQRPVHEYGPPPNMKIQPNPNPTMS